MMTGCDRSMRSSFRYSVYCRTRSVRTSIRLGPVTCAVKRAYVRCRMLSSRLSMRSSEKEAI